MSRAEQLYELVKCRKAKETNYIPKYSDVRRAAKADVMEGSSVDETMACLRELYYCVCEMELPAKLEREVERMADAATAKATVDAAAPPSGADIPTALACG